MHAADVRLIAEKHRVMPSAVSCATWMVCERPWKSAQRGANLDRHLPGVSIIVPELLSEPVS